MAKKLQTDPDIEAMSLEQLQQWVMKRRNDARKGMRTFHAQNNECCWDDLIISVENLLPEKERTVYSNKKFIISKREFLCNCNKFSELLAEEGVFSPDKPCSIQ